VRCTCGQYREREVALSSTGVQGAWVSGCGCEADKGLLETVLAKGTGKTTAKSSEKGDSKSNRKEACPAASATTTDSQVKNYSPGYMDQAPSRGHGASPQSGLGVSCKLCSSSKKLRGLGVRAQARRIIISLLFSVAGVSPFLFPPRSAMRRGAWKCSTGSR
jgi:hypothetical protein